MSDHYTLFFFAFNKSISSIQAENSTLKFVKVLKSLGKDIIINNTIGSHSVFYGWGVKNSHIHQ